MGTEINLKYIDLPFCVMSRNEPDLKKGMFCGKT